MRRNGETFLNQQNKFTDGGEDPRRLFRIILLICQKNDTYSKFVIVVHPKIKYNTEVKSGSMLKI